MSDVGNDGGGTGGDEAGEPEKVVVFDNEISDDNKENVIE